jgi:hypothetical protein
MTERHKLRQQIIKDRLNNPDNLWCYENVSLNHNLDMNLIDTDISWDYKQLSKNPGLTIEYILKQKDRQWNWNYISQYGNITFEIIINNLNYPWNFKYVGINKNITWDIILNNPEYPWDWTFLSHFKPLTWSIIKQNIDLYKSKLNWDGMGCNFDFEILDNLGLSVPWNFYNLSYCNSNINWDIVIKYKDQDWNWDYLSNCEKIDWNIIVDNLDQAWNWNHISFNLKITSQVLSTNHNWNWHHLSYNNSITDEILLDHPDKPWDYACLSSSRNNISKEFVLNNPDKPWDYDLLAYNNNIIIKDKITDWSMLSQNLDLSFEFIKKNIDKFIRSGNWFFLSINNNLTYELLNNNRNLPWNWGALSVNDNMLDIEVEYNKKTRLYLAAYKIQQYWLRAYYNPEYLICQRRLYNEFENLTSN